MRQKIALIVPYKNLQRNPQNICSPHIGIAYVASALESEGYRVDVIDALTNNYSHNQLIKRVVESNPDAVGITSTTDVRFQAMKIIQDLKRRLNVFIFAGGPHFTLTAQDALENIPGLDAVVIGEGEDTSRVLLNAYFGKGSFNEIKGVGYRDGGIKINPLRDPIKDLDSLLRPAWHLFSMRNYRKTLVRADGNKMLSMGLVSSRGCPYDCVFCANSALSQKRVSFMSPKRFVGELEFLNREYGFTAFDFWDDTFTVNKSHVLGVCDEILKRNLKINWYARCRIDTVDREVLQLMKKAGCVTLSYGIESGSPRISKVIRKNINLQKAREVVKQSADLGFCVLTFFMAGHPGETAEDLKMTLNLMDEFKAYSPHIKPTIGFTLIYPKTGLEEIARKNLLLPQHFSWNKPVSLGTSVFSAREDSIPIFENPDFKLPLMKIMIFERVNKKAGFLTKARKFFSVLFSIKGWKECKNVARLTFSYLRQSLINRYHET